jgi:hypothetical protein
LNLLVVENIREGYWYLWQSWEKYRMEKTLMEHCMKPKKIQEI